MEPITSVAVHEQARTVGLPVPRSKRGLVVRISAAFLAGVIPAIGISVWALHWSMGGPYRTALGQLAVGVALMLLLFLWLSLVEGLRPATTRELAWLERLAQQDLEVLHYLRALSKLGRPILATDVTLVHRRDVHLNASAEANASASQADALQARIWALVGADAPLAELPFQRNS